MSTRFRNPALQSLLLLIVLITFFADPARASAGPVLGTPGLPTLQAFAASVVNGDPTVLRGVYADGLFALVVIQQPRLYPDFVSSRGNSVTQFESAARFGTLGLLAHNYLSGRYFFSLHPGQTIDLIYGQGRIDRYRVMGILAFEAQDPRSPDSDFIDLETHELLSADDLFARLYAAPGRLIFQTCITRYGNSSWGRLFVTALPMDIPMDSGRTH